MVSKNQIKLITSLQQKKYRNKHGLFVAEGPKVVNEFLNSGLKLHSAFVTEASVFEDQNIDYQLISENELKKISFLSTPNKVLALFSIPQAKEIQTDDLILALDDIRDPGNLGTIIRLCDWFGLKELVCSTATVDCFNPKTVQASMGSLARINISYTDLENFVRTTPLPTFAANMNGTNVYKAKLPKSGILVMGNEANGISPALEELVKHQITIPRFGDIQKTESLNVATATAILLSEFRKLL
ncbi:RNA methyltransferase [Leptobacterium flavescens]|uniref:RNA methyltransferase n=1 Tax=Leptobacterium flavescens TaxID=472055 RepID=A0A6P0UHC8_9FLAO|nr:RNA methyltransferase [Leptobacterium flavescens]NER12407.1 RNA methyltransferase [Leptobacterium flavescens]